MYEESVDLGLFFSTRTNILTSWQQVLAQDANVLDLFSSS